MPRLRVTTALSLLALLIGAWGTHWLSGFTDTWHGPPPRADATLIAQRPFSRPHRRAHAPPHVVGAQTDATTQAAPLPSPPELVPLDTPPGPAPWAELRGHLDGRVVLEVATDASGDVTRVQVAQSSGDPVLDAHAEATVRRWRFAVPAGAAGAHGQLPMRFDSTASSTPP